MTIIPRMIRWISPLIISQKIPRIKALINDGEGIIRALQTAIGNCTGQYLTRIDADDIMPPDRLRLMVDTIKTAKENSIITGLVEYFGYQPISPGYKQYERCVK